MTKRSAGVVGGGIGGLATATLLARDGWRVTVLEQDLTPVGAGLLLQALGQQVAGLLGIADDLRARSTPVVQVDGRLAGGRKTMQLDYAKVAPGSQAWGVHRGVLFALLHAAAIAAGAQIEPGVEIAALEPAGPGWRAVDASGGGHGPFDLLIGADGLTSRVRSRAVPVRLDRPYPWGALWAIVPDLDSLVGEALVQRWHGTRTTLGLMPTGTGQASVFWSIRVRDQAAALAAGPDAFLREAIPLAPGFEPLVRAASTNLLPARYRDVVVATPVAHALALIGDAAHAMSPQLGLGASHALADAWTLAWALRATPHSVDAALLRYASERAQQVRYYRWWSMLMTPIFQSGFIILAPPRDLGLVAMSHLPWAQRQMVTTLMGTRTSPWSHWRLPGS